MRCITDGQVGQLYRRASDLIRRVVEGTLSFDSTMTAIQAIIEGQYEPEKKPAVPVVICGEFASCRCTICGAFFGDGDTICANGHEMGAEYSATQAR